MIAMNPSPPMNRLRRPAARASMVDLGRPSGSFSLIPRGKSSAFWPAVIDSLIGKSPLSGRPGPVVAQARTLKRRELVEPGGGEVELSVELRARKGPRFAR